MGANVTRIEKNLNDEQVSIRREYDFMATLPQTLNIPSKLPTSIGSHRSAIQLTDSIVAILRNENKIAVWDVKRNRLLSEINTGGLDVVYIWKYDNNHVGFLSGVFYTLNWKTREVKSIRNDSGSELPLGTFLIEQSQPTIQIKCTITGEVLKTPIRKDIIPCNCVITANAIVFSGWSKVFVWNTTTKKQTVLSTDWMDVLCPTLITKYQVVFHSKRYTTLYIVDTSTMQIKRIYSGENKHIEMVTAMGGSHIAVLCNDFGTQRYDVVLFDIEKDVSMKVCVTEYPITNIIRISTGMAIIYASGFVDYYSFNIFREITRGISFSDLTITCY